MHFTSDPKRRGPTERVCLTLLQSELDLAFSYLRLAETEVQAGKGAHATELIAKAVIARNIVLQELARIPDLFDLFEPKRELKREAKRLLESIRFVESELRTLWVQGLEAQ
jgi:hypothetical protein